MKKLLYVMSLLIIASMVLTACGGATAQQATPNSTASPAIQPTVIPTAPATATLPFTVNLPSETPAPIPAATTNPEPIESLSIVCPDGIKIDVSGIKVNSGSAMCTSKEVSIGLGQGFLFDMAADAALTNRDTNPGTCTQSGYRYLICNYTGGEFNVFASKSGDPQQLMAVDGQLDIPVEFTFDLEDFPFERDGSVVSLLGFRQSGFSKESISWQWKPDTRILTTVWYNEGGVPTHYFDMPLGVCINGWILSLSDGQLIASYCK